MVDMGDDGEVPQIRTDGHAAFFPGGGQPGESMAVEPTGSLAAARRSQLCYQPAPKQAKGMGSAAACSASASAYAGAAPAASLRW